MSTGHPQVEEQPLSGEAVTTPENCVQWPEPPRLLLVSPSLEFHPTTEAVLRYFSPQIELQRIGLGVEWRKGLEVMFRLSGAQRPQ